MKHGTYIWDGGVTDGISFEPGATFTYTVTGTTAEGCSSTDAVTVIVNPLPAVSFIGDQLLGCAPFPVNFSNTSFGGSTYVWNFGDGTGSDLLSPSHTFSTAGLYDVTLTVTSAEGCISTVTYDDYIDIAPAPIADFFYSPTEIDIRDTEVIFENTSEYADSYTWDFGDGSAFSSEFNPIHEYPFEGNITYLVTLTADSDHGCQDIVQQTIFIKDVIIYYIPNTFTPDGDSFNETFKPVFTAGVDIFDYHITIFNRFGEVIFESFNTQVGWNGLYGDLGLVEDGVYIWRIEFGDTLSDEIHYEEGHVTLLK